mmetsp:Transcript_672/g.2775  ORF Transcript_672/g.2775 Transcript_672/m.2775 type:complete len:263 (-) Transcript_672:5-793(-)
MVNVRASSSFSRPARCPPAKTSRTTCGKLPPPFRFQSSNFFASSLARDMSNADTTTLANASCFKKYAPRSLSNAGSINRYASNASTRVPSRALTRHRSCSVSSTRYRRALVALDRPRSFCNASNAPHSFRNGTSRAVAYLGDAPDVEGSLVNRAPSSSASSSSSSPPSRVPRRCPESFATSSIAVTRAFAPRSRRDADARFAAPPSCARLRRRRRRFPSSHPRTRARASRTRRTTPRPTRHRTRPSSSSPPRPRSRPVARRP